MTHLRDRVAQIIFDMGDGGASINCNKTAEAILVEIKLTKSRERIEELEAARTDRTMKFRESFAEHPDEEYDHE